MRILFIGDIVGASGRQMVADHLSALQEEYAIDFTIANAENAAHGKGITYKIYNNLIALGINCITMGNHTFAKREIIDYLDLCEHLLVPANLEGAVLGQSVKTYFVGETRLAVVNLYGEAFMNNVAESPFVCFDRLLPHIHADIILLDFHGESSGEKMLFAHVYKDKIQALVGTHTHVQTADERLIGKTAYISDVGMTGAKYSIIGRDVEEIYRSSVLKEKTHFTVADGEAFLNAVVIDIDETRGAARCIERVNR